MPIGINNISRRGGILDAFDIEIPDEEPKDTLYRWRADSITVSDGTTGFAWPEENALSDATAIGDPTYKNPPGASLYDGNDGHDWSSDANMPSGNEAFSILSYCYLPEDLTSTNDLAIITWGTDELDSGSLLYLNGNNSYTVEHQAGGNAVTGTTEPPLGEWFTCGVSYDGSSRVVYLNGSSDGTDETGELTITPEYHELGNSTWWITEGFEGYVAEIIVADAEVSASEFSTYHNNRV